MDYARAVFGADRRNPIDRDVVAKHMNYTKKSGASDKAIATMMQYGLLEKAGKGEVRVSQLALDVLHPRDPEARKSALNQAAFSPPLFGRLKERFADNRYSPDALRSFLVREGFLERAINPIQAAYAETLAFLEQEKATESDGLVGAGRAESGASGIPQELSMATETSILDRPASSVRPPAATSPILQEVFNLDEGPVTLAFPSALSKESYEELKAQLYQVLEGLTRRRFPNQRGSDSTWRTKEVRHGNSSSSARRF